MNHFVRVSEFSDSRDGQAYWWVPKLMSSTDPFVEMTRAIGVRDCELPGRCWSDLWGEWFDLKTTVPPAMQGWTPKHFLVYACVDQAYRESKTLLDLMEDESNSRQTGESFAKGPFADQLISISGDLRINVSLGRDCTHNRGGGVDDPEINLIAWLAKATPEALQTVMDMLPQATADVLAHLSGK